MRPIGPGDVATAACALMKVPDGMRAVLAERMLRHAQAADKYRKRMRRAHPQWGCGSLMDVASQYPKRAEPFWDNPEYLRCVIIILRAICACRGAVESE